MNKSKSLSKYLITLIESLGKSNQKVLFYGNKNNDFNKISELLEMCNFKSVAVYKPDIIKLDNGSVIYFVENTEELNTIKTKHFNLLNFSE